MKNKLILVNYWDTCIKAVLPTKKLTHVPLDTSLL